MSRSQLVDARRIEVVPRNVKTSLCSAQFVRPPNFGRELTDTEVILRLISTSIVPTLAFQPRYLFVVLFPVRGLDVSERVFVVRFVVSFFGAI